MNFRALVLLLLAPVASSAQPSVSMYGYSLSMGSVTVDQEQLYRLSFRPDLPLGRLGIGLDVELFVERNGDLGRRGWQAGSSTQTLDSVLRKIYYVRYGRPNDAVYVKIGALDDATLGYGLIMDSYRNTLHYPGIKKTGLQLRIANLVGTNIGLEGVINNLQDFQEGGALIGLRAFGYIADIELGVTFVADLDQYSGLRDGDSDGVPDQIDAFPDDRTLALDNDSDGVPDPLDNDDDNDGLIDADPGSGLSADITSALLGINGLPVDQDVDRHKPFNRNRVGRDFFSILGGDASYALIHDLGIHLRLYGQLALLLDDDDGLSNFEAQQQGVSPGNRQATGVRHRRPGPVAGFRPAQRPTGVPPLPPRFRLALLRRAVRTRPRPSRPRHRTGPVQGRTARPQRRSLRLLRSLGHGTRLIRPCLGLLSVPDRHQRPQTAAHRQRIPIAQTAQILPAPQARLRLFPQEQHRPQPQRRRHRPGRLLRADRGHLLRL